jgi:hypothetical protein
MADFLKNAAAFAVGFTGGFLFMLLIIKIGRYLRKDDSSDSSDY